MQTLDLGSSGLVNRVEEKILNHLKEFGYDNTILLDMSSIDFIGVETLVYLTSFIAKRKSKNLETKIKYYSNEYIRNFLDSARFFEVIRDVAGIDIHDLVVDLPNFFEKTFLAVDTFNRRKFGISPEGRRWELTEKDNIDRLRDMGFYPLVSLPFNDDIEKSYTLKEEPKNWTEGKPLISIIQKKLPDTNIIGDKISKHIIYESITNSIRHPKSDKLVISCKSQGNFFTIVIWDNGESIVETLKKELESGKTIKTQEELAEDPHSCYCIAKKKILGRPTARDFSYYFSFEIPDLLTTEKGKEYKKEEWFILLSSLFPGITRDPEGLDYLGVLSEERKPLLSGRGLTYLINAAVRDFGGEVRIRTSNYFINIKKADKVYKTLPNFFFERFRNEYYVMDMKSKYEENGIKPNGRKIISSLFKATVHDFPKDVAFFHGNMITIHIPQK